MSPPIRISAHSTSFQSFSHARCYVGTRVSTFRDIPRRERAFFIHPPRPPRVWKWSDEWPTPFAASSFLAREKKGKGKRKKSGRFFPAFLSTRVYNMRMHVCAICIYIYVYSIPGNFSLSGDAIAKLVVLLVRNFLREKLLF